ncbi:MAG: PIN domain-containing protein [Pseudomonadota bacterium]
MRTVLDACVLLPGVMRAVLLAAARRGHFEPVWSPRILEEWARAAIRIDPLAEGPVRQATARMAEAFPNASVDAVDLPEGTLPDPHDLHVLGTCRAAGAGFLVTRNHRDFPTGTLGRFGVSRSDPDPFLTAFAIEDSGLLSLAAEIAAQAAPDLAPRTVLKRANLPRLGKHLGQQLGSELRDRTGESRA